MAKDKKAKAEGGIIGFMIALVVLAMLGGIAGYCLKFILPAQMGAPVADEGKTRATASKDQSVANERPKSSAELPNLVALEPILVTLAEPSGSQVRLEAYVVFGAPVKDDIALLLKEMAEDLIAFLRTVTLSQIGSASGLEYLRDDMSELLQIRSKGRARGIVLKSLMIE